MNSFWSVLDFECGRSETLVVCKTIHGRFPFQLMHVWQVCGNCLPGMSAGCFSAFCSEWDMSGRLVYKRLRVFSSWMISFCDL